MMMIDNRLPFRSLFDQTMGLKTVTIRCQQSEGWKPQVTD
jgi:hypothetical protein